METISKIHNRGCDRRVSISIREISAPAYHALFSCALYRFFSASKAAKAGGALWHPQKYPGMDTAFAGWSAPCRSALVLHDIFVHADRNADAQSGLL